MDCWGVALPRVLRRAERFKGTPPVVAALTHWHVPSPLFSHAPVLQSGAPIVPDGRVRERFRPSAISLSRSTWAFTGYWFPPRGSRRGRQGRGAKHRSPVPLSSLPCSTGTPSALPEPAVLSTVQFLLEIRLYPEASDKLGRGDSQVPARAVPTASRTSSSRWKRPAHRRPTGAARSAR